MSRGGYYKKELSYNDIIKYIIFIKGSMDVRTQVDTSFLLKTDSPGNLQKLIFVV